MEDKMRIDIINNDTFIWFIWVILIHINNEDFSKKSIQNINSFLMISL